MAQATTKNQLDATAHGKELDLDIDAWQFHDPDTNTGMIQVFKRENAKENTQIYCLSALDPQMTYTIIDIDVDEFRKATGEELMCNGWTVSISGRNEAKIYTYQAK